MALKRPGALWMPTFPDERLNRSTPSSDAVKRHDGHTSGASLESPAAVSERRGHDDVMESSDEDRDHLRDLVRRGYDAISRSYRPDDGGSNPDGPESTASYQAWLDELGALLRPGARVLDLGCGAGVPAAKLLADAEFEIIGVDISEVQIERARSLVPGATFIRADMATWESAPASFDAVVSFYALIHLPLEDQRRLIPRLVRWLTPDGYLLATLGHEQWTGIEDYLGVPMFWDHPDITTYLLWFEEVGLRPLWHRFIPEGTSGHTLMLAQREGL